MFFLNSVYAGDTIRLPQASTIAYRIDRIHDFLWYLSIAFLLAVTFLIIFFVIKYNNSKKGRMTSTVSDNHTMEFFWTVGPLILMLAIFGWGYREFREMRRVYQNAIEINILARQWMWNFEYPNGRKTLNDLVVPKGKPVRLIMTSDDVIHSFFVPNFRLKMDTPPGLYTRMDFISNELGVHPIYCTEYCGTGHSDMLGNVHVVEPEEYEKFLLTGRIPGSQNTQSSNKEGSNVVSLAEKGKQIIQQKGCTACHSDDGSAKVGPSYKGIFGKTEEMQDGSKVVVDENYIRESLYEPQKKVVKGFAPSMPTYKGLVSEEELSAIIAYIKSLK
jgi:cytochrome c oxidase subunit 2